MDWNDIADCELLKQLKAGKLPHPTNAAFEDALWREALDALATKTDRDYQLATSAIFFGRELASLRTFMEGRLLAGLTRDSAIRLLAALANHQHLTMLAKVEGALRRGDKSKPLHLEQMGQKLFETKFGQQMTADDATATLVDTLPNWLHHLWQIPLDAADQPPKDLPSYGARALTLSSVERGLRDLWQGALWQGDTLREDGDDLIQTAGDPDLAQLWLIWDMRNTILQLYEMSIDTGAHIVSGGKLPPVKPVSPRTVVKVGRRQDGRRKFIVGAANGRSPDQRTHVSERDMLDRLHVGLFLDETLPNYGEANLTCRDLNAAWWVLEDLARLVCADLKAADLPNNRAIGRFAFAIELADLSTVLVDALGISEDRAELILGLFTCDPANAGQLFRRGLWAKPLIPAPTGWRRYLILAPLMVGSPVRRIEAWLVDGGIADDTGVKGKGKPFEAFVRSSLREELEENPDITDFSVDVDGLKRKANGEEIDLLIRLGSTVMVGEVKCFTSPSEALERANFLRNLGKAAAQARKKVDWSSANAVAMGARLGVPDSALAAKLKFVPVVVIAQSFGIGLSRDGVPIVDYHFLRLLLGSKDYQGDTRFERDVGMISNPVTLYKNQADLEARVVDLLDKPPPLDRYYKAMGWRRTPFATSDGTRLMLELPELNALPIEANTLALPDPAVLMGPRRRQPKRA